jgi:hypothetical protein
MTNGGNTNEQGAQFPDDPNERLHLENEILKLKMQAETGAIFESNGNLPPEIESAYLQHILQFEEASQDIEQVSVYDFIGKPAFRKAAELDDREIKEELNRMMEIMEQKAVLLDVLGSYDKRIIYRFLTEELFDHETDQIMLPGMVKHFIYEEFHPNHKMDIHDRTTEFLQKWFDQQMGEHSWELSSTFILTDARVLSRNEVLTKIHQVFDSFSSFAHGKYVISDIGFQWDEEKNSGMGYAEGGASYEAALENGETLVIEGPFKFYLSNDGGWWNIFYFIFPGFSW